MSQWRDAALFNEQERAALAYAEAVTATPPQVMRRSKASLNAFFTDETME